MVRLIERRRRSLARNSPPRIKFCVSWRTIFLGLVFFYGAALIIFFSFFDTWTGKKDKLVSEAKESFQQDVSAVVDSVHNEVGKFLVWTGIHQEREMMGSFQLLTFYPDIVRIRDVEEKMQLKHPERHLQLCRRLVRNGAETNTSTVDLVQLQREAKFTTDPLASCLHRETDKVYFFYNPLDHDRYVCNQVVPAKGVLKVPLDMWASSRHNPELSRLQTCLYQTHLFPVIPNTTARGLPPTTIRDNTFDDASTIPRQDCNIPCHYAGNWDVFNYRTIDRTPFTFVASMEGVEYYRELKIDIDSWILNHYYATVDFKSDIPLPYFSFAEYDFHKHKPVSFDKAIKGALFLARNCNSQNNREALVNSMIDRRDIFRVDSISECLHNAGPPNGLTLEDKEALMQQYLFYFAFENQNAVDYVTEKLWSALVAGTVPVYLGAPNIKEHVPDGSVIFVNDFRGAEDLARYLAKVASDRKLYESYHAWRFKELPDHFLQKYNITRTHNVCRTCRWAYARMYGLGWSHQQQELLPLKIARHACLDRDGMLTWPVRERWFQSTEEKEADNNLDQKAAAVAPDDALVGCPATRYIPWQEDNYVAGHWQRTIYEHDGVIDLRVKRKHSVGVEEGKDALDKDIVLLELIVPFDETAEFRQLGPGRLQWQNETSRLSLLFRPAQATQYRRMNANTIQLKHPESLRIIVEDVDRFHEGAAKLENYFGKLMKQDWELPIEVFVANKKTK